MTVTSAIVSILNSTYRSFSARLTKFSEWIVPRNNSLFVYINCFHQFLGPSHFLVVTLSFAPVTSGFFCWTMYSRVGRELPTSRTTVEPLIRIGRSLWFKTPDRWVDLWSKLSFDFMDCALGLS